MPYYKEWRANYFDKKVCAVRFKSRSAAANGRAAAGSAADFMIRSIFNKYIFCAIILFCRQRDLNSYGLAAKGF